MRIARYVNQAVNGGNPYLSIGLSEAEYKYLGSPKNISGEVTNNGMIKLTGHKEKKPGSYAVHYHETSKFYRCTFTSNFLPGKKPFGSEELPTTVTKTGVLHAPTPSMTNTVSTKKGKKDKRRKYSRSKVQEAIQAPVLPVATGGQFHIDYENGALNFQGTIASESDIDAFTNMLNGYRQVVNS